MTVVIIPNSTLTCFTRKGQPWTSQRRGFQKPLKERELQQLFLTSNQRALLPEGGLILQAVTETVNTLQQLEERLKIWTSVLQREEGRHDQLVRMSETDLTEVLVLYRARTLV